MLTRTCLAAALTFGMLALGSSRAEDKNPPAYAELSKLLHQTIIPILPPQWEDRSEWGPTIPIEPNIVLSATRTKVKVGDKEAWPHGTWRRTKLWFDEPAKDVKITVKDLRKPEGKPYQVQVEAVAFLHAERERRQWQKGIQLVAIHVAGDATVSLLFDVDVSVAFNLTKLPPEVLLEPKVTKVTIEMKEFAVNKVGNFDGPLVRDLSMELKGVVQELVRTREPTIEDFVNSVIAKKFKDGKIAVSASTLLKSGVSPKAKD